MTTIASDTFSRTVSNGWGTATQGGAWTSTGNTSYHSVNGSKGVFTLPASQGPSNLLGLSQIACDITCTISLDKVPVSSDAASYIILRGTNISGYSLKIAWKTTGEIQVVLLKTISSAETALTSYTTVAPTLTAGTVYRVRARATGTSPTTLQGRLWLASGSEPSTWQVAATDTESTLQSAGGIGLRAYVGGLTNGPLAVSYDDLVVDDTVTAGGGDSAPATITVGGVTYRRCEVWTT